MSDCIFELNAVTVRLQNHPFFRRLSWRAHTGETWAVVGPNGAGKSLLAALLHGDLQPDAGSLRFGWPDAGEDRLAIARVSVDDQRAMLNPQEGYYQSRYESLGTALNRTTRDFLSRQSVEGLNPFEVLPARPQRRPFPLHRPDVIQRLALRDLFRRRLHQLSNGEQRRVLLAHALLQRPRLLLLDDPCAGLDVQSRAELQLTLGDLIRAGVCTVTFARRHEELPAGITHVLELNRGRVTHAGPRRSRNSRPAPNPAPRLQTRSHQITRNAPPPSPQPAAPGSAILLLRNATVRYHSTAVLKDVHWTIRHGEHWAVLGPNGAGKSTLLSLILGDHPQTYAVDLQLFGQRPGAGLSRWEWLRQMGFVSPELHFHQPDDLPTLAVVCSGYFDTVGLHSPVSPARRRHAARLLRQCGVVGRAATPFGALAHSEQRLALLARALVKSPRLLILDEPCQGLDPAHRLEVVSRLDAIARLGRTQLVVVTHHADEIPSCVRHVLHLVRGQALVATRG